MNRQTRDRLVLPLLIPVGALAMIAVIAIGFSRILLSLRAAAATVVALIAGAAILAVSARLASFSKMGWSGLGSLIGAVVGVSMLAGGLALVAAGGPAEEGGAGTPAGGEPEIVSISAENIAFDTATLRLPAGTPFTLRFDNRDDGVPHNVAIYSEDPEGNPGAEVLFEGEIFDGPASRDYDVPALEPGEYFFRCDVHPSMQGKAIVEETAPGEGEAGGATTASITAKDLQFDTAELSFTPGVGVTLFLDNEDDGVPHNVAIYADDSLQDVLFRGEIFDGPAKKDYTIPPLEPGTYFFHCEVHPSMQGTVRVG